MIKYTKEEFPARFSVSKHVCKYCGVTFYSNYKKGDYDTGTCRTYDWKRKKAAGGIIPSAKPKEAVKTQEKQEKRHGNVIKQEAAKKRDNDVILYIPFTSDGWSLCKKEWNKYFPGIDCSDAWNSRIFEIGENTEYIYRIIKKSDNDNEPDGIYITKKYHSLFNLTQ